MRRVGIALAAAGLLAGTALADPPARTASPAEAEAAVKAMRVGLKAKALADRVRAVRESGRSVHPAVADELVRALRRSPDPDVRKEALMALAAQRSSARRVAPAVARWISEAAGARQERELRGDPGFPLDPRTGDPAVETGEGRAALALLEADASGVREAIRCLRSLRDAPPDGVARWAAFLRDAHDPLVVEVLDAFAAWRTSEALPAMLELYRCYPAPDRWETGAVVDLAGTNASAKRRWMLLFGHPGKQRARPDVHAALQRAVAAITGRAFDDPVALAVHLEGAVEKRH